MTVHKSQGSEFGHTVLVLPKDASRVLSRELVYTGVTRARRQFTLVTGRSAALAAALAQRTQRAGGLLEALDPLDGGASASGPPMD
jgi:exodeoxyribonuclease V alpha subunit